MLVKNKVAIVTGSARGIGFAIAQVLAEEGAKVVISDLSMSSGEESAKQLQEKGYEAVFIPCDISKRDQVNELFSKTKEHFGTIDVLVNNAGINRDGMLHKLTDDDWDKVIDINLKGTFNCMQEAAKLMREQGSGRIVNISSASWLGNVGQANYAASKAGVITNENDYAANWHVKGSL